MPTFSSSADSSAVTLRDGTPASRPARILAVLAILLTVWVLLSTFKVIRAGWVAIPVADDWDRWMTYVSDHYSLGWFFREHVDHRLVVAKVFFAIDHLAFAGRGWFLLFCCSAIQLTTGFLLWFLAGRAYRQQAIDRLMQALVILCCVLSAQQWVNLIWPFQIQFPLVYCAAAAALCALWKSAESAWNIRWLAAAIALAIIATYSMANGILVWLVMLIAAVWLRMPRKWLGAVAVSWGIVGIAYFYHWRPSSEPGERLAFIPRITRAISFWFGHLGSPVAPLQNLFETEFHRFLLAVIPGILLALTLLAGFILLWLRPQKFTRARAMLLFYSMFLAGSSAAMAWGRSGGSLMVLYEPRYLTPSYLLWLSMLLWIWPVLVGRLHRTVVYGAICAGILFGIAIHQRAILIAVRDRVDHEKLGQLAVVDGVTDPDAWLFLYHTPAIVMNAIDYLKANSLTVYTEEWTHWPGVPLQRRFSIDHTPDACQGDFEQAMSIASPLHPGWRVTGWAWDNKAHKSPRYIVLADDTGIIAGVALAGFLPPASLAALSPKYTGSTWNGYINGQARPITAYLVEADERSICAFGTRRLHRAGGEVPFKDLGALLPVSAPEIAGAMVPDGFFKGSNSPGKPPVDGPVYGSFPDSEKGSIRIGLHLDGHTDIAIPIVTGPDTHGLSLQLRDAATKEVLAQLDPPSIRITWWAWRPDLPQGKELDVELVVEDKGSGWGQWLAIGWPHLVKP
jgi:hypothetical protein